ncbi:ester cyclase [Antarcticimicrobium sediminis]|uniref:SnoaL-like polyketide cyclase n=1 Tax=Antarcticimicrobium sediminis TaxID=2546227 RepID=A0A4R5EKN7_9RHOB|nr:nuclear transport factor 2 family protein [Antarcticimicrobium sediminis]TDE35068.1 hypothetical protein E1B25_18080 [Antarcticimicrobium sediminis]
MTKTELLTKTELFERWCDEVWRKGNLDAIDDFLKTSTLTAGVVPHMQMGPADFRELVTVVRFHVGPIEPTIQHCVEQGDWLAVMMQFDSTRADNGAPIQVPGQVFLRFEGDKMVEAYNLLDFMSFFEQLGLLPPDALTICLTGHKLDWS